MDEAIQILVVDDEARMRALVRDFLSKAGYAVLEAADGEEALEVFFSHPGIALVILDVMMPRRDGWEVCREIREYAQVPIIMLTARGEERDELLGFQLGVDEYIAKPFSPRILVARVEALLRRSAGEKRETLSVGGIVLDPGTRQVTVDGGPVELSGKDLALLRFFLLHPGIALSRETILDRVWDYDYDGDARTIDTHVKKLRSKLGEKGQQIKTVWGLGYKFEP